jgi:hypothetical protein
MPARSDAAAAICDLLVASPPSAAVTAAASVAVDVVLAVLGSGGGISDGRERLVLQAVAVDCIDNLARCPDLRAAITDASGIRVISSTLSTALAIAVESVAPRSVRDMERHTAPPLLVFARNAMTALTSLVDGSPPPPVSDFTAAAAACIRFIRVTTLGCAVIHAFETLNVFASAALNDAEVARSLLDAGIVHATVPALAPGVTSEASSFATRIVCKLSVASPALRHAFRDAGAIELLVCMITAPNADAFQALDAATAVGASQRWGDHDDAAVALSVVRSGVVAAAARLTVDTSFDKDGRWAAFEFAVRLLLHPDPAVVLAAAQGGALLGFRTALVFEDSDRRHKGWFYLGVLVALLHHARVNAVPPGSVVRDGGSSAGGDERSALGPAGGWGAQGVGVDRGEGRRARAFFSTAALELGPTKGDRQWSPEQATELGGLFIASGIPRLMHQALVDAEQAAVARSSSVATSSVPGWRRDLADGVTSSATHRFVAEELVALMDKYVENAGGSARVPEMMRRFAIDLKAVARVAAGGVVAAGGADSDGEHSCWYCDGENPFVKAGFSPVCWRGKGA